jgi:biotin-(acetyl-CoA carboxylase) ligase
MSRKLLALMLTLVVGNLGYGAVLVAPEQGAQAQNNAASKEELKRTRQAKKKLEQLGTGARVRIKLQDATECKGFLGEMSEHDFILKDEVGVTRQVRYGQVKQVEVWLTPRIAKQGSRGSRLFKRIAIGTLVVVGLLVVMCAPSRCQE